MFRTSVFRAAIPLLSVLLTFAPRAHAQDEQKPNVLLIAIDDLNDWIGCLDGHPQAQTPNIDRLAKRGVLFTNAHCASPACNPSRAAIFSGKMPWKTGIWSNKSKKLFQQHPDAQVIPRAFSDAGYVTLGTGKLMHSSGTANRVMFDHHFNPEQRWSPFTKNEVQYTKKEQSSKGSDNPRHVIPMEGRDPVVLPLNRMPSDRAPDSPGGESFDWGPLDVTDSEMGDTQITDWAIEKLDAGFDGKPFFMGVGYYRPHIPLFAPARYFQRFDSVKIELPPFQTNDLSDLSSVARKWAIEPVTAGRHSTVVENDQWEEAVAAYLACTTFVDHQVGRLLDALDSGQFGENTLIVLWSDHGWHLGEKQHWGKWTGWERSTRVPLIVVPPIALAGQFAKSGASCHRPVCLIDLYPTLTELCEVEPADDLDGTSLVPLLKDVTSEKHRRVLTVFDRGNATFRTEEWRYIRYADGSEELYDVGDDPHAWTNLASVKEHSDLIRSFRESLPKNAR